MARCRRSHAPDESTVIAASASTPAGTGHSIAITVTLLDGQGNPIAGRSTSLARIGRRWWPVGSSARAGWTKSAGNQDISTPYKPWPGRFRTVRATGVSRDTGQEILIRIEVPFCVSTLILTPLCGTFTPYRVFDERSSL